MQEIDFRIWNGSRMIYPGEEHCVELVYNRVSGWNVYDTSKRPHKLIAGQYDEPKLKLMQYVGEDMENTKIYVGDILTDNSLTNELIVVEEGEGLDAKGFVLKDVISGDYRPINSLKRNYKKIGTIYENPELIEETELE